MRDGFRYTLLSIAGLIAVLLIISLTAYQLTTYGSIRGIIGSMAVQPEQQASLRSQYNEMARHFAENPGDTYSYSFGGLSMPVSKGQVAGLDERQTISLVLDTYTSSLYYSRNTAGIVGALSSLINEATNVLCAIAALTLAIVFIALVAGSLLPLWASPLPARMRDAGRLIAVAGLLAFLVFAMAPGVVKSIFWGSIAGSDLGRDMVRILEPRITSSLLVNSIATMTAGGLLYLAGLFLQAFSGGGEAPAIKQVASSRPASPDSLRGSGRRSL